MQPSRAQPAINRFFTEPQLEQLPSPYHSMLPPGQGCDRPVISASPRQPFFKTG